MYVYVFYMWTCVGSPFRWWLFAITLQADIFRKFGTNWSDPHYGLPSHCHATRGFVCIYTSNI